MEPNEIISSGLLELYVLGMANEQETATIIAMAKDHPEVKAEIISIEKGLELYAALNAEVPAEAVKEEILSQINTPVTDNTKYNQPQVNKTPARIISISPAWKYVAAASVLLLIGSLIFNYKYYDYYNKYETASKEKSNTEQQLLTLQRVNDELKNDLSIVQSKYSEPVALHKMPDMPDATAKIFWMKNTGDVYLDPSNLPDAPSGMQYQLWGFVDGKPVDGGLIVTTKKDHKYQIIKMKSFGHAEAFAVTLETAGGNPQPKGKIYVMGKM